MAELGFAHRFIPAREPNARTLLLLHGTGGDESDLLALGRALDPAAALLSPRGQVLENGAPRFFRRFSERVFDQEDVVRRAHELADFVSAASQEYQIERANLVSVGYSNGANITGAILLLRPEVLQSAILLRAMVVLSQPPAADLSGHRVLINNGDFDQIIPKENGAELAKILRDAGAEVTSEILPADHGLTQGDLRVAKDWLRA